MMSFWDILVLIIVVIFVFFYLKKFYGEVEYVKSTVDNRIYLVRKLKTKQRAANLLAELNADAMKLINHLVAKFPDNEDVKRLYENYSPESISEGSPDSGYTSYSVNKGEKIVLCLRQKDDENTFVDKNVMMYIFTHECAHVGLTHEIGHTDKFWSFFRFILTEAVAIGVYEKVDFAKNPVKYCGITITSSVI